MTLLLAGRERCNSPVPAFRTMRWILQWGKTTRSPHGEHFCKDVHFCKLAHRSEIVKFKLGNYCREGMTEACREVVRG